MKMKLCSIYDSKAGAWLNPMSFQSTGQAIRSFGDAVNDGKSEFWKHPEDYTLFVVGEFDQLTGELTNGIVESLCVGINLLVDREVVE